MALQFSEDRMSMQERRREIIQALHELPNKIKEVLELDSYLKQLCADVLHKERSLLIMGRGMQNATCLTTDDKNQPMTNQSPSRPTSYTFHPSVDHAIAGLSAGAMSTLCLHPVK